LLLSIYNRRNRRLIDDQCHLGYKGGNSLISTALMAVPVNSMHCRRTETAKCRLAVFDIADVPSCRLDLDGLRACSGALMACSDSRGKGEAFISLESASIPNSARRCFAFLRRTRTWRHCVAGFSTTFQKCMACFATIDFELYVGARKASSRRALDYRDSRRADPHSGACLSTGANRLTQALSIPLLEIGRRLVQTSGPIELTWRTRTAIRQSSPFAKMASYTRLTMTIRGGRNPDF